MNCEIGCCLATQLLSSLNLALRMAKAPVWWTASRAFILPMCTTHAALGRMVPHYDPTPHSAPCVCAEEPTPPIGSARLSYAKTLQLLNNRMVKRMTIMADGKLALVEVPIYMGGHDYDTQRYDASDFSALYAREFPEWRMEMLRYYVELPGDFWQESNLHRLIKRSMPHRTGDGCALGPLPRPPFTRQSSRTSDLSMSQWILLRQHAYIHTQ